MEFRKRPRKLPTAALFLLFLTAFPVFSQNTSNLSCWESRKGGTFQTRHAKTPVAKSGSGSAYAEVTAEASTDIGQAQFCKNKADLFYAREGDSYKMVYEKPGLDDQGVGMRVLGWSHGGTQLLIELSVWGYDRDTEVVKSALVFEPDSSQVKELPIDDAIQKLLGRDCEFELSVVGWEKDDSVLIRLAKTPPTTHYQQTFCVERPTVYAFQQSTGKMSPGKAGASSAGTAPR